MDGRHASPHNVAEIVLCMRRIRLHWVCVQCFRGADTRDIRFSSSSSPSPPTSSSSSLKFCDSFFFHFVRLRILAKRVVYCDFFFLLLSLLLLLITLYKNPFEAACSLRNILYSLDALLLAQIKKKPNSSAVVFSSSVDLRRPNEGDG